jgi:hypothetical protein
MIEEVLIQIVYEFINKKLILINFYKDAFESIHCNIKNIQNNLAIIKQENSANLNILYEKLIILHIDYSDYFLNLHELLFLFKYCFRKNKIKKTIYLSFNAQGTIESLLYQTIDTMVYLKNSIPIPKASCQSIEKACKILDNFKQHGHYLPNLSKDQDEHKIGDIILYLRHVNKTVAAVYELAIMEIIRNVTLQDS